MDRPTKNDILWLSIGKMLEWSSEQDWTGYTKEQREEITANKTAEIYGGLIAKYGFRW